MRTTKGTDQPAHPRSLISTFVVRCLDSIIFLVYKSEISSFYCDCAYQFESTLVAKPEDRFSRDEAHTETLLADTGYQHIAHVGLISVTGEGVFTLI